MRAARGRFLRESTRDAFLILGDGDRLALRRGFWTGCIGIHRFQLIVFDVVGVRSDVGLRMFDCLAVHLRHGRGVKVFRVVRRCLNAWACSRLCVLS